MNLRALKEMSISNGSHKHLGATHTYWYRSGHGSVRNHKIHVDVVPHVEWDTDTNQTVLDKPLSRYAKGV